MFENYPDIVSVDEFREMLQIGRNKAYQLLNDQIKSIKIGRIHKIPKKNIIEFINQQQ